MTNIKATYLIEYSKPKLFAFHWFIGKFVGTSLQLCNDWITNDLLTYPFSSSTYLFAHTPKTSMIDCLLITYTLFYAQNRYLCHWSQTCSKILTLHQASMFGTLSKTK
jgi:hypothetical protein